MCHRSYFDRAEPFHDPAQVDAAGRGIDSLHQISMKESKKQSTPQDCRKWSHHIPKSSIYQTSHDHFFCHWHQNTYTEQFQPGIAGTESFTGLHIIFRQFHKRSQIHQLIACQCHSGTSQHDQKNCPRSQMRMLFPDCPVFTFLYIPVVDPSKQQDRQNSADHQIDHGYIRKHFHQRGQRSIANSHRK